MTDWLDIDITSDIEEVLRETDEFFEKDIAFVTARALNNTAFDVRKRIVGSTWDNAFKKNNSRFPGVLFRVDKVGTGGASSELKSFKTGEIDQMVASVFAREDLKGGSRSWLVNQIEGGTKNPRGSAIAIPKNPRAVRNKGGSVSKRSKPLNITSRKDHFLKTDSSGRKRYIAKRTDTGLEIVFTFTQAATITPRLRFYEDAFNTVDRVMLGHWGTEMGRVIARKLKLEPI